MNVLLAAGSFHGILSGRIGCVVNKKELTVKDIVPFINETHPVIDLVLLTDDGIGRNVRGFCESVIHLQSFLDSSNMGARIVAATSRSEFTRLSLPPQISIEYFAGERVSFEDYKELLEKYKPHYDEVGQEEKKKKNTAWWNKKITPTVAEAAEEKSVVSHGISRTIAITGHRGAGLTSTVANLAEEAHKQGLSVMIVDLDTLSRGMNMYFGEHTDTVDEDKRSSLIRLLARPQSYETSAFCIKPGLYMSTLPYAFGDKKLEEQFVTCEKIISMISFLKNNVNLCILDLPFEIAGHFKEILIHVDSFGLCINNSLYSVFNTVRHMEFYLQRKYMDIVLSKTKLIVTDYNDRATNQGENFTPRRVTEILKTVSDGFDFIGEPAGYIPHYGEFDNQIETEILSVNSNDKMHESYKNTLIKLLEGVD